MAGFNIKHWFADGAFRTIIRNSAWLGSSNVVSALLGLLALSCAGKGMTPAMFGVLVIVQSYAKSISDFIKFQTWQLVVQYGTPALTNNNPQQFRNVVSFSFSLDIVSGAVAIVDAPRDKCTLSCAINGIHAAFHYLKKNYISGCVMTVPTGW